MRSINRRSESRRLARVGALSVLLFPVAASQGAESRFVTELNRLALDRDKALASAAAPINKKYKDALSALLERATKASDLDAALKIRNAIESLTALAARGIDPVTVKTRRALQKALIGTSWSMAETREGAPTSKFVIKFASETDLQFPDHITKWEVLGDRTVKFGEATVVFDAALGSYQCSDWYGDGPRYGVRK
jgi:hypothetical protein